MTDLNKLRSEFEELPEVKQWIERLIYGDNSEVYIPIDETEENNAIATWINGAWFVWKLKAKAQAVPETQQKLTDTYYWEGSDYVVDCPFEYDIELDKGEVLELKKWQRTESTKVYFANIYKDEDNFEILQFTSKAEAEKAVAENLKFLEASESGAEG
ncbi:hypothetical protein [Acinetobacter pittii]|uniref:hypothetical protein n=1 Tax=Acinetobacter pittii TaxID=48296 RepID=UPI0029543D08|nr:hypothetical protein [Acinetobacter pittii]MDV7706679.1 hypothetical protein [Acinetobacter pittii]MDV7759727.1 hypothetical protein [Acinetobacter pittii]